MIHKYWCGKCRKFTEVEGDKPKDAPVCQCAQLTTFLETVQGPPVEAKRKPPCLEEWVHAGYDAAHYKLRFSTPEWGPTWSDPTWKPAPKQPEGPEPELNETHQH